MNYIVIIASPRTGSNYFLNLLENSISNLSVHYEIFHRTLCYTNFEILNYFKDKYNLNSNNETNLRKDIYNVFKNDPKQLILNIIKYSELTNKKYIIFKIFDNQLDNKNIQNILIKSKLVIFLKRNLIDTYISLLKVNESKKWNSCNTTNLKVIFDEQEYIDLVNKTNKWYCKILDIVKKYNIDYINIYYEDIIKEKNIDNQLSYIINIINNKNIKLNIKESINYDNIINKQDNNRNKLDSIINKNDYLKYIDK